MSLPIVCIKLGGRVAADEKVLDDFIKELKSLQSGYDFVLIHGGGAEVSRVSRIFEIEPVFVDGVRTTRSEEMDLVDMVLGGKVNKQLVRRLFANGVNAAGLSGVDGATVIGEAVGPETRTGKLKRIDTAFILNVLAQGLVPVISPVSMDETGGPLNINADEVALAIAGALPAGWLVFISDIPGILKNGRVITGIDPHETEKEIEAGVITGGMIPKVHASIAALENGVERVVIGGYEKPGDLQPLLSGGSGTTILKRK
jgi:acetylglutamate kinase